MRELVGRSAELEELTRGLADANAGRGRFFLISGEPGIGKTRLADEVSRRAHDEGALVLWGRAWEAGGAPAYFPWLGIVSGLTTALDDAALADCFADSAPLVAELVPGLRARLPAGARAATGDPKESRFRLFRALTDLVRRAAAVRTICVIVDDLHAADESSLAFLHFLSRETRSVRALLLGTFRDVEARLSADAEEALGRITREGTTLPLSRLPEADAARFIRSRAGDVSPDVAERLFRRTQGNPLFLEEMVRLLGTDAIASEDVPLGVREVMRQRLGRATPEVRAILDVVAIVGDEAESELVAEASSAPHDAVTRAFAEATRFGVLTPAGPGRVRFTHALFREVLVADVEQERAEDLHGRVAAVLVRRSAFQPNPAHAEIAHHLLGGSVRSLSSAVDYALCAAEQALSLFAFEEAVALLERGRSFVVRAGDPPREKARVLVALGRAHVRRGAGLAGQECCLEAAELARGLGDSELLAEAALAFSLELTAALVNPAVVAFLAEALEALPQADSPLRVRVQSRLAAAMQPHRDLAYPIGLAREAILAARRIGDPGTLLDALYTGMSAMMDIVDAIERLPVNLEIERLASATHDSEKLLRTEARLVFDNMELGDLPAADGRIDAFEKLARTTGASRYLWRVPLFRSMRAMMHGRFAESEELCEEAWRLARAAGDPQLERCQVFHVEGLLRAAERHDRMIAHDPDARRMRSALYSGSHWQNGGSAFTYSRVEDAEKARLYLDLVPMDDWPLVANPPAFLHLGEPLALVGEPRAAALVYDLLLPARERLVSWGYTKFIWEGPASRVLGLLAGRLGRFGDASSHFEDAIQRLERLGAAPFLARTRYEYGRMLLERGDREGGEKGCRFVAEASEAAGGLGMSGLAELAARRIEGRPRAGTETVSRDAPRAAPPASTAGLPFAFVPEGEYWTVTFDGATFRLKDSLGIRYLARLFADPDRAIHVLELSSGHAAPEGEVIDAGDAGEFLDPRARASYRARLVELREELGEAESFGDFARAARARAEVEFLGAELSRAVGLGGRARRAGSASERARSAVQRRIRNAVERVRDASPELADVLEKTVRTGTVCLFSPKNALPRGTG